MSDDQPSGWIRAVARFGLAAKGIVYCLLGLLAFMSAFHIGGRTAVKANSGGVFSFILEQPAGRIILTVLTIGLLCYCLWRFIQSFAGAGYDKEGLKGITKRFTYFFSGVTYFSISYLSFKILSGNSPNTQNDSKRNLVTKILQQPAGEWLLVIVAIVMAGIGIYQMWYGNSEKYRKHVDLQQLDEKASASLLRAGKVGYISRGIVWLVIAFLFFSAARHHTASEAGDISSAFAFIQQKSFGAYLLAALGLGLVCYGVMNFIRAAFEQFRYKTN